MFGDGLTGAILQLRTRWKIVAIASVVGVIALLWAMPWFIWLVAFHRGQNAFHSGDFVEAAVHLKKAVSLRPAHHDSRNLLTQAVMRDYTPAGDTPDNVGLAQNAQRELEALIRERPSDEAAIAALADLTWRQRKLDESRHWYGKLAAVNPDRKEAWRMLGVIAWAESFPAIAAARAEHGLAPEDRGVIADMTFRSRLRDRWLPVVDRGIETLNRAIALDGRNDENMHYMSLLHRERAWLQEDMSAFDSEVLRSQEWVRKGFEARTAKAIDAGRARTGAEK